MRITELLSQKLTERTSPVAKAESLLKNAYQRAYQRGCSFQFTVPAIDQDVAVLNQEIITAMMMMCSENR
jgi:hypothetical protein